MPASPTRCVALRNGTIGWTLAKHTTRTRLRQARRDRRLRRRRSQCARCRLSRRRPPHRAWTNMRRCRRRSSHALPFRRPRRRRNIPPAISRAFAITPAGSWCRKSTWPRPVRGARIVLTDNMSIRADMTASWLAQMGWEIYVLEGGYDGALEAAPPVVMPKPDPAHRYRRPYEGTDASSKGDAGLSRLGIRPRRAAPARRHAWFFRDLI